MKSRRIGLITSQQRTIRAPHVGLETAGATVVPFTPTRQFMGMTAIACAPSSLFSHNNTCNVVEPIYHMDQNAGNSKGFLLHKLDFYTHKTNHFLLQLHK